MNYKRLSITLITGALLGVVCIIGAQVRSDFTQSSSYLFAFWFNRVLMGLVIGFIAYNQTFTKTLIRGALIGIIVSFAFYSATDFQDFIGFAVGAFYGVIIEYIAFKWKNKNSRSNELQ